jgi:hypothetical protein
MKPEFAGYWYNSIEGAETRRVFEKIIQFFRLGGEWRDFELIAAADQ